MACAKGGCDVRIVAVVEGRARLCTKVPVLVRFILPTL